MWVGIARQSAVCRQTLISILAITNSLRVVQRTNKSNFVLKSIKSNAQNANK